MIAKPSKPPKKAKPNVAGKKGGRRYPWDKWLKVGSYHVLRRGRDYPSDVADVWMLQSIWRMARLKGVKITCSVEVDVFKLRVVGKRPQARDPRAERRAQARERKKHQQQVTP